MRRKSFFFTQVKNFCFPADERPSCKSSASFWLKGNCCDGDDNDDDDYGDNDDLVMMMMTECEKRVCAKLQAAQ